MTDYVATLIARPGSAPDLAAALTAVTAAVPDARIAWLGKDEAVDIGFMASHGTTADSLSGLIGERPVDVIVQPVAHRRKSLLVADMDSTMIGQECIDELADYAGFKAEVAEITERAMRGEVDFALALRERAALLSGLPLATIAEVLAARITPTPGARTLVQTMRANGARTVLVSGGFTDFAEHVREIIGFDEVRANRLLSDAGTLLGTVAEPILGPEAKEAALIEVAATLGVAREDTLAVGDGANDIAMVKAAGLGVAYHAKPRLAAVADARIDHGDLTALLFAQGYTRQAFRA